jgi:hypothetical protein
MYEHHWTVSEHLGLSRYGVVSTSAGNICILLFPAPGYCYSRVMSIENNYEYEWVLNPRQQVICWCFTLNNYTEDECSQLKVLGESGDCKYLIVGKEIGEKGTPHLQCFLQLRAKKTFGGLTAILPKRCAKVRPMYRRSNPFACFTYCSKDNDFIEYGIRPTPAGVPGRARQAIDYAGAITAARDNQLDELEQSDPGLFLRYYRTLNSIRDNADKGLKDLDGCCGLWVYGPSNAGKSHWIRETFGRDNVHDKPINKWWGTYRGQRLVLLDDVRPEHSNWIGGFLLRWADKYPFPVEIKNSETYIRPEVIAVTSNYTISAIFGDDLVLCEALLSRFKVVHMHKIRDEPRPHVLNGFDLDPYADDEQ